MPLDPDELGPSPLALPVFKLSPDCLNQVLVFDRTLTGSPPVSFPIYVPLRDTLYGVLAVGTDLDVLGIISDLESPENGC